jgi:hypothetical protein
MAVFGDAVLAGFANEAEQGDDAEVFSRICHAKIQLGTGQPADPPFKSPCAVGSTEFNEIEKAKPSLFPIIF